MKKYARRIKILEELATRKHVNVAAAEPLQLMLLLKITYVNRTGSLQHAFDAFSAFFYNSFAL